MKRTVLVIGGGPAGITAALRLNERGYAVTLLEQHSHLGGRLISSQESTDAIPPVLLGCHKATLSLLETLGTAHQIRFSNRLCIEFLLPGGRLVPLRCPWLPGPLHVILGLMTFQGLPFRDRWRILTFLERTWESDPMLPPDLNSRTANDWLTELGQSVEALAHLWSPLARFFLGDDLTVVPAAMLVRTLAHCFFSARHHSSIGIPTHGIRSFLLTPASERLTQSGATIRLETFVNQIRFDAHRVTGIQLQSRSTLVADWYVAALPHRRLCSLLPESALTNYSYFEQLTRLTDLPAVTVHLWMDRALPAPRLVLLAGRTYHWLVSRVDVDSESHRTLVSLVATGISGLLNRPDQDLLQSALDEIGDCLPIAASAKVLDYRIVREPQAFLSLRPGTASLRPLAQSPFPNLFLAGDWTDTGLPATLESAILSGNRCAEAIMATNQ
ncbi:MAG TPA: hydroxysqualene dehydroxylase HpnE [Nitrospiraceae bacterium]|nr:hydroxysqualene dehydroxylase HpnE [Nitrospiraceae bacterium]